MFTMFIYCFEFLIFKHNAIITAQVSFQHLLLFLKFQISPFTHCWKIHPLNCFRRAVLSCVVVLLLYMSRMCTMCLISIDNLVQSINSWTKELFNRKLTYYKKTYLYDLHLVVPGLAVYVCELNGCKCTQSTGIIHSAAKKNLHNCIV